MKITLDTNINDLEHDTHLYVRVTDEPSNELTQPGDIYVKVPYQKTLVNIRTGLIINTSSVTFKNREIVPFRGTFTLTAE